MPEKRIRSNNTGAIPDQILSPPDGGTLRGRRRFNLEWRATVDRIEGSTVILIPAGHQQARLLIARDLLPDGIRDGSVLLVQVKLDEEATALGKREVARLQKELENGSSS